MAKHPGFRALALCSMAFLGACAYGNVGPSEKATDGNVRDTNRLLQQARAPLKPASVANVRFSDDVFTSSSVRRSDRGQSLPREWERSNKFEIGEARPLQLFEIGTAVTDITRIPVNFAPEVFGSTTAAAPSAAPAGAGGGGAALPPGAPTGPSDINALLNSLNVGAPIAAGNVSNAAGGMIRPVESTRATMKAQFKGRLSDFLDQVASHFGVAWEYNNNEIRIFRNVTRTYTVSALPYNIDLSTAMSSSSSSEGSSGEGTSSGVTGGGNQSANSSARISIWDDITKAVTGIVGSSGRVDASASTGTITVTAPPPIVTRVQSYLDGQNERLSKQVTVHVQVLSVELKDNDAYQLDLNAVFREAAGFGGIGTAALGAATQLMEGATGGTFQVTDPSSGFNGSQAIIQALSSRGRVSMRNSTSVTTLNGVPTPVMVGNSRGYVSKIEISDGTTSGSSTSSTRTEITPGSVTTGFTMNLMPRVSPTGDAVLMQFSMNISELVGPNDGFNSYTASDGSMVQLPNVNVRNFAQQAQVKNGGTLVLTGFDQSTETADRRGTFFPEFMGLGGKQAANRGRTAVVILMTPTVMTNQVITTE